MRIAIVYERQTSLPLGLFSAYACQETHYMKTNKSSPGAPLGEPGDGLHKDRLLPESFSEQTTYTCWDLTSDIL